MLLKTKLNNMNSRSLLKMLAVCPALAVSTTVIKALVMGAVLTVILLISELSVSLLRKVIPVNLRNLIYLAITAFSASLSEILLKMWFPSAAAALGVYFPILAVSCIVLMRIECCAAENGAGASLTDALVCGGEFTLIMVSAGFVRELFGAGRLFTLTNGEGGFAVFSSAPLPFLQSTAGVLLMVAFAAALAKFIKAKRNSRSDKESESV